MNRQTSTDAVVSFLKEEMKRGHLVPGQRLAEIDVTEATGASRAKVRSAFQALEVEGLVTIEPFRGASVKQISHDEVIQLYLTREVLEGLAARTVAERGDRAALRTIKALQKDMNDAVEKLDFTRFATLNDRWHRTIVEESGNEFITAFLDRLMIPVLGSMTPLLNRRDVINKANGGHQEITRAILDGKPAVAERLMRRHIAEALAQLEKNISRVSEVRD